MSSLSVELCIRIQKEFHYSKLPLTKRITLRKESNDTKCHLLIHPTPPPLSQSSHYASLNRRTQQTNSHTFSTSVAEQTITPLPNTLLCPPSTENKAFTRKSPKGMGERNGREGPSFLNLFCLLHLYTVCLPH